DESICNGEQVTLTASGSQNYSWNNGVVDGAPFSPTNTLDYIVTADSAGCQSADTLTVFVNQPTNSTLIETALDSFTLNGQTYNQSGTYTQVIPNAAGCDSTITLNLSLDFTGLQEFENSFTISPNPATDELTISTNTLLNENYILFDPQGRKVLSGSLTGTATLLNISQLARGNYLLQIGEKQLPVRIVKN
ncbi:MAG: T9SS type A sorting domain-containing protein, partial [Crocinitomicaceae bacterium]|nr:T9SS type A sorting domain-containing protein [Crocinitomicaceae bacterium]